MKLTRLHRLDLPDPEILGIRFTTDGACLRLEYSYMGSSARERTGAVRFFAILGYRFEQYRYVTSFTTEPWATDIVNAIVEVRESPWVEQIEKVERGPWPFAKRHFVAYLAGVGLFEVIADHFEIMPSREGAVVALSDEESGWLPRERL